ncbi:DUF1471 domain-containing protein [Klebsiella pneumoniae]|uniref:YdgH/BhsA/McbA-like domain containing protein n=1 Tax=Klebsiella pneumoniae TaxID=573 RepID=UPI001BA899AC|nr:YdgH/BhsA/McbA-like domain containing protein [Klebsiella pneumoniae]MBQ5265176.1 DUF1471 domain-containing protein [Klebsiella pneumoniae]
MKTRHSVIIAIIACLSAATAYAADNNREVSPTGYVSAWGTTLDEMTEGLRVKSVKAGAKTFEVTSARAGNRYYGTAALYK